VSLIKVDFPEPETPVTQVNTPTGIDKSTLFKLLYGYLSGEASDFQTTM
jgi:ABC-type uncharacterized transport system YnjBCD ATPase subunit